MSRPKLTPKQRAARDKLKGRARLVKESLKREERLFFALQNGADRSAQRLDKLDGKLRDLRARIHFFQYDPKPRGAQR